MAHDDLCDSLLVWIQTFDVDARIETAEQVADGVALSKILCEIGPTFFDASWLSRIKKNCGDNWRLKVSNLKKVQKGIMDYYNDVLGQQICDFPMPDVNRIGELNDHVELGRLLQLVLGCAVNCDHKEEYINVIMSMEEAVQHVVMNSIQELMSKEIPSNEPAPEAMAEMERQLKRTLEDLHGAISEKEEIMQRCHELDLQVATLIEEKNTIQSENDHLMEKIDTGDSLDDPSTPAGRRYMQLQQMVEELQEENFRLESQKDDSQIKMDMMEREIQDITDKNEQLTTLAEEAQSLKDEMDILRHTSDKATKYEATIETYKKKLEDLGDLKRQVKILEDKNTMYMQNTVELEEELKKANALKSQLENYKRQVHELHTKVSEQTRKADKAEFDAQRHQEKVTQLLSETERLRVERDSLKETNEELACNQLQGSASYLSDVGGSPMVPGSPLSFENSSFTEMLPPEVRERIIRLQHENKMLKLKQGESTDERAGLLQSLLDDSNARKNELESENRIGNQHILALEAELEELKQQQLNEGVSSTSIVGEPPKRQKSGDEDELTNQELRKKLQEHKEQLQEVDTELLRKKVYIDDLEPKYTATTEKVVNLQGMLEKKEDDMKSMEERYKKYLEKAKAVIRTLDPKHNPTNSSEMQLLRNQLHEKQKIIEHLENEREKSKLTRDTEEKLIVSAWYNMDQMSKSPLQTLGNAIAPQSDGRPANQSQQQWAVIPGQATSGLQSPLTSHNQRTPEQFFQVKGHGRGTRGVGRDVRVQRVPGQSTSPIEQHSVAYINNDQFSNVGTPEQFQPAFNSTPNASKAPMSFLAKQRQASRKGTLKGVTAQMQPNVFPQGKQPFGQMLRPEERMQLGVGRPGQLNRSKHGQEKSVFARPGMLNR